MKNFLLIFSVIFFTGNIYAQEVHQIRFVWLGPQSNPVPTIVISVEKLIVPDNKRFDRCGKNCVQTDLRTFKYLDSFCHASKLINLAADTADYYQWRIIYTDKSKDYIADVRMQSFVKAMQEMIVKNQLDKQILIPFENYIAHHEEQQIRILSPAVKKIKQ